MKNILLATDFSSTAYTAALCAGELAFRTGARLIIFHALSPVTMLKNGEDVEEVNTPEEVAQKELDDLAYLLHNRFGISVSRLLKPGFGEDEIPAIAEELQAELIILGTQGEAQGAFKEVGRVATTVREKSKRPVICVPPEGSLGFSHQIAQILNQHPPVCNKKGLAFLTELNSQLQIEILLSKKEN